MQVRLRRFEGLKLNLKPGWYQLPSHLHEADRQRFLDLIATGLAKVDYLIEYTWDDFLKLKHGLQAGTVVHLSVPREVETSTLRAALRGVEPRLGLFTIQQPGLWPEVAWDELEVKSALATWLRQALKQPTHPLAGIEVRKLPVRQLISATCEPIELLELVETSVAFAGKQLAKNNAVDWQQCASWSIGRRLANRLAGVSQIHRAALARLMGNSPDGALPRLLRPDLRSELTRLGLAHFSEGDGMLVPLARRANEPAIIEILAAEGIFAEFPEPERPNRARAHSRRGAVLAFNPHLKLQPGDPWLVDLRRFSPELTQFSERLRDHLRGDSARVAILQRPRSGADTMIRVILAEASELADVSVAGLPQRTLQSDSFHFVDLLFATLVSLLHWSEQHRPMADETRAALRSWFAKFVDEPNVQSYLLLGSGIAESVSIASLVSLIDRLLNPDRAAEVASSLRGRTDEVLNLLNLVIDDLQRQLASHGKRLCLHFSSLEHLDVPSRIDEVVVGRAQELGRLRCHLVFGLHVVAKYFPAGKAPREVFTTLMYPEASLLVATEVRPQRPIEVARALLGVRADLDQIFDAVEARLEELVLACGGSIGELVELAQGACEVASEKVDESTTSWITEEVVQRLRGSVPENGWLTIALLDDGEALEPGQEWVLRWNLALPYKEASRSRVHPLLLRDVEYLLTALIAVLSHAEQQGQFICASQCGRQLRRLNPSILDKSEYTQRLLEALARFERDGDTPQTLDFAQQVLRAPREPYDPSLREHLLTTYSGYNLVRDVKSQGFGPGTQAYLEGAVEGFLHGRGQESLASLVPKLEKAFGSDHELTREVRNKIREFEQASSDLVSESKKDEG
ncbi:MAG: hypothetical protein ACPG4T_13135 [Nannocystaceae bacterium]